MPIPGKLLTTAMAVMPHTDLERALELPTRAAIRGQLEGPIFSMIQRPRGVHLWGNPDWDFLLGLDLDILSLDVYTNAEVFGSYAKGIGRFLDRKVVLAWGIVPTNSEPFQQEDLLSLEARLVGLWEALGRRGVDLELILDRGLLSPATCCLANQDVEATVERAFETLVRLSAKLRVRYGLSP